MERLKKLFQNPELHAVLFCLVFVLFSWPLMTIVEAKRDGSLFVYLFLVWSIVIGALLLIAASHRRKHSKTRGTKKQEG